jgi:hypothetical protein
MKTVKTSARVKKSVKQIEAIDKFLASTKKLISETTNIPEKLLFNDGIGRAGKHVDARSIHKSKHKKPNGISSV